MYTYYNSFTIQAHCVNAMQSNQCGSDFKPIEKINGDLNDIGGDIKLLQQWPGHRRLSTEIVTRDDDSTFVYNK